MPAPSLRRCTRLGYALPAIVMGLCLVAPVQAQQSPVATAAGVRTDIPRELRGIPLDEAQRVRVAAIHSRFRLLGLADSLAGRRDSVTTAHADALRQQEITEVRELLTPAQRALLDMRLTRERIAHERITRERMREGAQTRAPATP